MFPTHALWAAGIVLLVGALVGCGGGDPGREPPKGASGNAQPQTPADRKRQSVQNLRQIAGAMKRYAQTHTFLPPAAYLDPTLRKSFEFVVWGAEDLVRSGGKLKGKTVPLFSWRVALLPYLDEKDLAKEFKMDEPWDSEHNKTLLARMPDLYASAAADKAGLTHYQVFVGKDTPFNGMEPPRFPSRFQDGTHCTFLVVEAGEAVPWTKPQDLPYDPRGPLPKLGGLFDDGVHAAMADGAIRFFRRNTPEKAIRAAITPSGGEAPDVLGDEVK